MCQKAGTKKGIREIILGLRSFRGSLEMRSTKVPAKRNHQGMGQSVTD